MTSPCQSGRPKNGTLGAQKAPKNDIERGKASLFGLSVLNKAQCDFLISSTYCFGMTTTITANISWQVQDNISVSN